MVTWGILPSRLYVKIVVGNWLNWYNRPLDLQLQQLQPLDGCSSNPWMDSDPRPNPNPRA